MSVHLHIDKLVLDESLLGGERAAALGPAIEQLLTQRLLRMAPAQAWRHIGAVPDLPRVNLPAPRHAGERLAPRIADAVGRSLDNASRAGPKP